VAITGTNRVRLDAACKALGKDALILASDAGAIAAQRSLAKTVGEAFGKLDIRCVNAVSPGPIATPLYDKLGLAKDDQKAMSDAIASDEAAFTVGSELVMDGGMSNL
jgi:NAD(P)-dependent dehydrogenase (short-subunit alcohol dehydrogenase family)